MSKIGFIGLGHMGQPIVKNLLARGHEVRVFDINPSSVEAMKQAGALSSPTLTALAQSSDIIITMLQTGEQVAGVCADVFAQAKPASLFIDSSSIDVATSRELHAQAKSLGFSMVDAPVSGGVKAAEAGTLTIMVGGTDSNFARAKPTLEAYGKNIVHAGPEGNGQVAKICNNMILGISMIAISEAYTLAKKLGLPPEKLFEISSQASGQCWSMTKYSPVPGLVDGVPSNNDYRPGFAALMMLKDLKLSQQAAASAQVDTPLGKHARDLYQQFVDADHGGLDFSAIIKMFEQ